MLSRSSQLITERVRLPGTVTLLLVKVTRTVEPRQGEQAELRPGILITPLREGDGAGGVHKDGDGDEKQFCNSGRESKVVSRLIGTKFT